MPRDGILCRAILCVVCSRLVRVAEEGTEENIGVLCPDHKNEVAALKSEVKRTKSSNSLLTFKVVTVEVKLEE